MAKSLFLVASLLLVVAPLSMASRKPLDLAGSYEPIKNIDDPHVQSIGEFAVNEHNAEAKTELKFQKVISGYSQVVAGANYKLRLTALDGTVSRTYGTVVYTDLSDKNHLVSFSAISN